MTAALPVPMLWNPPRNPPPERALDERARRACVESCRRCVKACEACADACLVVPALTGLASTLRLKLVTAGVCRATTHALSPCRRDDDDAVLAQVSACAEVCEMTAAALRRYVSVKEECWLCARACDECAAACRRLLES